jgi:hypothetical protein
LKSKLLEHLKKIEQLRESLKQEQARSAGMEINVKKVDELEARIKELSEKLGKISGIAASGKPG